MQTKQFTFENNNGGGITASSGSKLTDWKNEPDLTLLKNDLEASRPFHDAHMLKVQEWSDLMKVQGREKPTRVEGRSSVQPKLVRRQAEWRYSALAEPFLNSEKLFNVSPVTFEDEAAAKQNELVLNWQFRTKIRRIKLIDNFVRTTVDDGTCVLRTGWKRTTTKVKEQVPSWTHYDFDTPEELQFFQTMLEERDADPENYKIMDPAIQAAVNYYDESGIATKAVQTGVTTITVDKVVENRPTVDIIPLQNVYIDPSCEGDLDKALFIIVSFETNKAELLREGKRYKNLDMVNWESATGRVDPNHATKTPQDFSFKDPMRRKVIAYEYWGFYDVKGDGTLVPFVATWIENVMVRMELNPFPDEKLPFVLVSYLPTKNELYGEADAELLGDNQRILGATTRSMIDLLGRSANGQMGVLKGMLDPLNRRRFDKGLDYEFNPNTHPSNGLVEHKSPELPQSGLIMLNLQNQEAEALTGTKSFSGGLSGEAYGKVATGIRGMLDAAGKREMNILRRMADGMTQVADKILAMNAIFLSEEEVIRVTNREFVKVKREDLKGNFDLSCDISTTEVDNMKAQDLGFVLQTLGPNAPQEITTIILSEIADLKRMPALAEKLRTFKPQPTPEQQQMMQLEMEKKQKEIALLDSEIELNHARAKQASAIADKTNLDFVEQETGTAHQRDMAKQQSQAKGNQQLQVTKALTSPRKEGEKAPDIESAIGFNQISDRLADANAANDGGAIL